VTIIPVRSHHLSRAKEGAAVKAALLGLMHAIYFEARESQSESKVRRTDEWLQTPEMRDPEIWSSADDGLSRMLTGALRQGAGNDAFESEISWSQRRLTGILFKVLSILISRRPRSSALTAAPSFAWDR